MPKAQESLLALFPRPLLDDLVDDRWLPIVGAGLSRHATTPDGQGLPLWGDLGRQIAADIGDSSADEYPYTDPVDAISAYEHAFSRTDLVSRLHRSLRIEDSSPGRAHDAFARLRFDVVVTTNIEFLLERQYEALRRYCYPIIEEDQLSASLTRDGVALLKLHADVHHPDRLVVTESDYDGFVNRYPLLATYFANLLITRTAVLIGYSLDDPDYRQIWSVVGDRLQRLRRPAYRISVGDSPPDIARFARRGVKVINLPGPKSAYEDRFVEVFGELREYWERRAVNIKEITKDDARAQWSLPSSVETRLVYFAVPLELQATYREFAFPAVSAAGMVPVTADDFGPSAQPISAEIDAVLSRASAAVVDPSTATTAMELGTAVERLGPSRVLIVASPDYPRTLNEEHPRITRPSVASEPQLSHFAQQIRQFVEEIARSIESTEEWEPRRLLAKHEWRAAVISAIGVLDSCLRARVVDDPYPRVSPAPLLLQRAVRDGVVTQSEAKDITKWRSSRNRIVHQGASMSAASARALVDGVDKLTRRLECGDRR